MQAADGGTGLTGISLDRVGSVPVYRQLYASVREAVLAGRLPPGARLPSARSLAAQLAVARGTVEAAYHLLAGEGFIVGRGASGTVVDPGLTIGAAQPSGPPRPVPDEELPQRGVPPAPFAMGLPALDAFPRKTWTRLATRAARSLGEAAMTYQHPAGLEPLRRAIAAHLAVARGIACHPGQVLVTNGFQGALGLVTRVLLRPGERAWIEDPGFHLAREALVLAGLEVVPVPVDGDGLDVAPGRGLAPEARLAVVPPTHQFPTGATLPLARRLDLLRWAVEAGAWIVEDDYDSEFRYRGRPLPALKGLDGAGRVLYAGTFSKILFPGLRLGYLVVPDALVQPLTRAALLLQPVANALGQATVAAFMVEGHLARHVSRMRRLYAERRAALVAALGAACGDRLQVVPRAGGMHLLPRLRDGTNDAAVATRAQAMGLAPVPLSRAAVRPGTGPGLLLGFANIPPEAAEREAARLAAALDG